MKHRGSSSGKSGPNKVSLEFKILIYTYTVDDSWPGLNIDNKRMRLFKAQVCALSASEDTL